MRLQAPRKELRSMLQIAFLLATLLVVAASSPTGGGGCCSCNEKKGSDFPYHAAIGDVGSSVSSGALVERYHDFETSGATLVDKDLAFIKEWLPGNVILGLHIPTAPDASQPGSLVDGDNEVNARVEGSFTRYQVPLIRDTDMAACIADLLPPDPGAQWEALVPANDDYLGWIPDQTATIDKVDGWLKYVLDFHGSDRCNGCSVKLTYCTPVDSLPEDYLADQPLLRLALRGVRWKSDDCLICTDPIPTVIRLTSQQGVPLSSPPVAWLSAWGGPVLTGTYGPLAEMEYILGHSLNETKTFELEPIHSEEGWMYSWFDVGGNPITQLTVSPSGGPLDDEVNVVVRGNVPSSMKHVYDTIHLTATCASDPSLQAFATSIVGVFPNPSLHEVADVGITKQASAQTIAAGESVDFTVTVTNYEETVVTAIFTDTLSPGWIISDVTLPEGCERNGTQITCPVRDIPAGSAKKRKYTVHTVRGRGGTLSNLALVQPRNGVDYRLYDNQTDSIEVTVEFSELLLHLPIVLRP